MTIDTIEKEIVKRFLRITEIDLQHFVRGITHVYKIEQFRQTYD